MRDTGGKSQKSLRLQTLSPSLVVGLQQSRKPMEEWHPKHNVFHIWGRKEIGSAVATDLNSPQHTSTLRYDWSFSPAVPRVFDLSLSWVQSARQNGPHIYRSEMGWNGTNPATIQRTSWSSCLTLSTYLADRLMPVLTLIGHRASHQCHRFLKAMQDKNIEVQQELRTQDCIEYYTVGIQHK